MNDREIRQRLRGFDAVWARVRGGRGKAASDRTRDMPLMPRRRGRPCRRRCRSGPSADFS
jgi:hypothetical protein